MWYFGFRMCWGINCKCGSVVILEPHYRQTDLLTRVFVKSAYYTLGFTSHIRPFDWEPPIHWREQSEFRKIIYVIIIPRIEKLSTASMCRVYFARFWRHVCPQRFCKFLAGLKYFSRKKSHHVSRPTIGYLWAKYKEFWFFIMCHLFTISLGLSGHSLLSVLDMIVV